MIDGDLVESLVIVESSGNRFAWNPEPRYPAICGTVKTNKPFRPLSTSETLSKFPPADFPLSRAMPIRSGGHSKRVGA